MSEIDRAEHTPVASYATRGLRLWSASKAPHGPGHLCLICSDVRKYLGEAMVPDIDRVMVAPAAQREERAS